MAFDDFDTSDPRPPGPPIITTTEEFILRRNRGLPGMQVEIFCTKIVDGKSVSYQVEADDVFVLWNRMKSACRAISEKFPTIP